MTCFVRMVEVRFLVSISRNFCPYLSFDASRALKVASALVRRRQSSSDLSRDISSGRSSVKLSVQRGSKSTSGVCSLKNQAWRQMWKYLMILWEIIRDGVKFVDEEGTLSELFELSELTELTELTALIVFEIFLEKH